MSKVWTRPASAPYPAIYSRFSGRVPKDGGPPLRFRVQDAPEELTEQLVDFMCEDFMDDEPMCRGLKIKSDKESMDGLRQLWHRALQDRLALVCLQEADDGTVLTEDGTPHGKPIIAGTNITMLGTKVPEKSDQKYCDNLLTFFRCFNMIVDKSQVFDKYGVNEILSAFGLSVARAFRGQNIGSELLRARVPLCKAVGLKVTGTVFTAKASQTLARRCGFVVLAAIPYREFKEVHNVDFGDTGCDDMEYMALEIK